MGDRRWFSVSIYAGVFCLAMIVTIILTTAHKLWIGPQAVATPTPEIVALRPEIVAAAPQPNNPPAEHRFMYAANTGPAYTPPEQVALADPSNYGERYSIDAYGQPLNNEYLAVLHETVWTAGSAINLFQTFHPRDEDQASYHTLIDRDGTVIYIVPPDKRAYGAGNSVFNGPNGPETVVTNPEFASSVNNFA